jgi:hypothetical protein
MAKKGVTVEQIHAMTQGYGLLGRIAEPVELPATISASGSRPSLPATLVVDGGFSVTGRAK